MRAFLITTLLLIGSACSKKTENELRLGYFPNITHGQGIVGTRDGTFQRALGDTKFQTNVFNAGPAAMEALLGGSIDVAYVGPGPAINAFVRSKGDLRVIAAAANGGAALISHGATAPNDLRGKKVAVPQTGNTQDIALRYWLKQNDLKADKDVTIVATPNPEIDGLFRRGEIEAAWVPEPWAARLIAAGGKIMVDERTLWPNGTFSTTLLVARRDALQKKREAVERLLRAHVELTRRWQSDPSTFATATNEGFRQLTGKALPEEILRDAFSRLEPALEPDLEQLKLQAEHAHAVGYLESAAVEGLVDPTLLQRAMAGQ